MRRGSLLDITKVDRAEAKEKPLSKTAAKKAFLESLKGFGWKDKITDEQCAEWIEKHAKEENVYFAQTWHTFMGRIGNVTPTIENWKTGKSKSFDSHPDWRPIGKYSFSVPNWNHSEYIKIEGYIQDWKDLLKISDTDSFTVSLYKHPVQ